MAKASSLLSRSTTGPLAAMLAFSSENGGRLVTMVDAGHFYQVPIESFCIEGMVSVWPDLLRAQPPIPMSIVGKSIIHITGVGFDR